MASRRNSATPSKGCTTTSK
ncbi:hypothetical protein ACHAWF_000800 [Thalassiosira exigua]